MAELWLHHSKSGSAGPVFGVTLYPDQRGKCCYWEVI